MGLKAAASREDIVEAASSHDAEDCTPIVVGRIDLAALDQSGQGMFCCAETRGLSRAGPGPGPGPWTYSAGDAAGKRSPSSK